MFVLVAAYNSISQRPVSGVLLFIPPRCSTQIMCHYSCINFFGGYYKLELLYILVRFFGATFQGNFNEFLKYGKYLVREADFQICVISDRFV